ncbi:DNA polymerase III subunit gamma and tau [Nocardiopsis gilva YIM 90087]|uniref:DNA polymerase III subunit gamma/tau n=1 Tax=Nocardiopsis gilva YIM 90087 TaxID=1235441 RepID=A0A223S0X4_9ACTN|nr:DNA polymerase III subunit gamma and tau [Nocardiopsis gilva]ASU81669.1 DNA polymerase III subunit gamma and tau [Nocardiopsis gilva YIM 90087]
MSIALYRKYRPATFGEVRGQEHVTEPLRQALRNGRINHAYLFSGPRGCGKTSSARILARSLNCVQGPTPDPCGECEPCVALAPDGGGSIDVIEIDAASHGGVDDARELRERAFFSPVNSRYKVYIIDEAHMVTREGFNALLKLVEEPPPHLKFVFATTEPDKVIGTIRSRTHHYPFRLIPPSTLRELMEEVLTEEGVPFDPAALPLVVRAGAGSARDSLSILDQLLAGSDESGITRDGAVALLGYTDSGLLTEMVDALGARDGAAVFGLIDRVMEGGHDPRRFTADLLERTRDLVVLAAVPDALDKGLINVSPDAVDQMREQATRLGPAELTRAAEILNQGLTEMRGATSPRLLLELLCARVLLPAADPSSDGGALLARLDQLERRVASGASSNPGSPAAPTTGNVISGTVGGAVMQAAAAPAAPVAPATPAASPPPEPEAAPARPAAPRGDDWPEAFAAPAPSAAPADPAPAASPAHGAAAAQPASGGGLDLGTLQASWGQILEAVKGMRRFTWMVLSGSDARPVAVEGSTVQLGFSRSNDAKGFSNSGSDQVVAGAIQHILGMEVRVTAVAANGAPPVAPQRPAAPTPPPAAPAPAAEPAGWDAPAQPQSQPQPSPASPAPEPQQRPAADEERPQRPVSDLPEPPPDPYENAAAAPPPAPEPEPQSAMSDPADDPSVNETPQPTGYSLIQSELGGKLIDEIDHTAQ